MFYCSFISFAEIFRLKLNVLQSLMCLRIRFVRHTSPVGHPLCHVSGSHKWKKYFYPPWASILHFIELVLFSTFFLFVIQPAVYDCFMYRHLFVKSFYPDSEEDEVPVSKLEEITDYLDNVNESLRSLLDLSFINITMTNGIEQPLYTIRWKNGSILNYEEPEINLDLFTQIDYLKITMDFRIISMGKIKGCSRWLLQTDVFSKIGLSFFSMRSSLRMTHCENEIMHKNFFSRNNTDIFKRRKRKRSNFLNYYSMKKINGVKSEIKSKAQTKMKVFLNEIKQPDIVYLNKYKKMNIARKENIHSIFYKTDLRMFRLTYRISFQIALLSCINFIILLKTIHVNMKRHFSTLKNYPDYKHIGTLQQYHFTIGYWRTVEIISTILSLSSSILLFVDSYKITQFPSQYSIEFLSIAMFFSFVRINQWFGSYLPCYQLIVIIREAAARLIYLIIGILPIVTGLSLFGIFTFGFIDDSFETFRYLVQRMITSGMGDSIDDFFIIINDGTERTAWLGFFYVGVITAAGMWIVFTSCIATVSYIHEVHVVSRDESWKPSTDESQSESEIE